MNNITLDRYATLAPQFNPEKFNATEWALLAQEAGMSYITVTAKHHDGFALWPTKLNNWNIKDSTPFGRDFIGELAAACKAHGLGFFIYMSHLDWYIPARF